MRVGKEEFVFGVLAAMRAKKAREQARQRERQMIYTDYSQERYQKNLKKAMRARL